MWPAKGATGNVSLLAALYVLFGDHPLVILPVNAALHAASGLLLFLMSRLLWPGRVGVYSGVIAASLFVVFPSALNWYAQIHKDGFAILGMLLALHSWLRAGNGGSGTVQSLVHVVLGTLAGVILIVFVRPYSLKLLILSGTIISVMILLHLLFTRKRRTAVYLGACFGVFLVMLAVVSYHMPGIMALQRKDVMVRVFSQEGIEWKWQGSSILPGIIDRLFEDTAFARVLDIYHSRQVKAHSVIDENIRPDRLSAFAAYTPRATLIAIFAPFPSTWFANASVIHIVSIGETAVWYILMPGIFLTFRYRRSLLLSFVVINSIVVLAVLGFTHPNIGTLYRFRYPYIFLLMLVGTMGWIELIRRKWGGRMRAFSFNVNSGCCEDVSECDREATAPGGN